MNLLRLLPAPLLLLLLPAFVFSQIADNFSDGDFTQNPAWQGDAANFKVNTAGELQLNAVGAGQSTLWVAGNMPDSNIWEMNLRLTFDPSGSNLLRVLLQTDQADLAAANGYYLELGETGSADAIRFFRQDGAVKTQLAVGQPGLVANSPDLHVLVKRSSSGVWTVDAAPTGSALQPQFTLTETTWPGGANRFFGLSCVYTSSNATKFYFDNINIRPDIPDTTPPVLVAADAANATTVQVFFDENLDSLSAINAANYNIDNGVGQPLSAALLADRRTVSLLLNTPLATGDYTLQTSGVKDVSGNISTVQTADFQFVKIDPAAEFDIIINEIMSDPAPSVGLPEVEWLELYNRSANTIDLATLRIQDATGSPVQLPTFLMESGTYLVLTALANASTLEAVAPGKVLGVPIGASTLNNDGDVLTLSNSAGQIIDRVAYSLDCSAGPGKSDGGWAWERINSNLPCLGRENWQYCPVLPGGTPGAQNASFQNTSDEKQPRLFVVFPESPTSILLAFSEGLDEAATQNPTSYRLMPPRVVASAQQLPGERNQVRLTLSEPLQAATLYALLLEPDLEDCSGNAVSTADTILLGLPEKPETQDVVVNEVMFNPATGNARYVEFFNRSGKVFDCSEFFIANFFEGASVEKITANRLFLPGQHLVFTECPNNVRMSFENIRPIDVVENNLPSMTDDAGNITLYWAKNGATAVLDSFGYSEDFHNALFTDSERDGVALERIDPESPTNSAANWTSASPAKTDAPGTPTLSNSQRLRRPAVSDLVTLSAERLSPDGDSFEDFLDIRYKLPQAGFFAAATIFDADGIPVKRIARQELIGTEGSLRWDGDLDDGSPAKPGIYVLFLELYAPSGEIEQVKKAVAVVRRF